MQRDPELRAGRRELECRRHHSYNLTVNPIDTNHAADDGGISSELSPPECVTEHHSAVATRLIFARTEYAPDFGADTEHGKQVRGNRAADEAYRLTLSREIDFGVGGVAGDVHRAALLLEGGNRALRIVAGNFHKTVWVCEGKPLKQNCVDQREDRRVAADAESQRQRGDCRESFAASESAQAIANVLPKLLNPGPTPSFTDVFLDQGGVSERAHGTVLRLFGGNAGLLLLLGLKFEVRAQLALQIGFLFLAGLPSPGAHLALLRGLHYPRDRGSQLVPL